MSNQFTRYQPQDFNDPNQFTYEKQPEMMNSVNSLYSGRNSTISPRTGNNNNNFSPRIGNNEYDVSPRNNTSILKGCPSFFKQLNSSTHYTFPIPPCPPPPVLSVSGNDGSSISTGLPQFAPFHQEPFSDAYLKRPYMNPHPGISTNT